MTTDSPTAFADTLASLHGDLIRRYPAEATQRLEDLPIAEILAILAALPVDDTLGVWERLSPEVGRQLLKEMDEQLATMVIDRLDPACSALLLRGLEGEHSERLLGRLAPPVAAELRRVLAYPPDCAGALMDSRIFYFHPDMSVNEALAKLRGQRQRGFRLVFIVDTERRLVGMVEIQDLALAETDTRLLKLMRRIPAVVNELASQEEIVELLDRYNLTDLPVADFDERFIGVVRHHALMDAARDESSADIQTMVGVSKDERAFSSVGFSVRKRLPWLQINLVTAFMAAAVVGLFEETIATYTALAVFLPVVAGQSGNSGAQALAVTMRGLALREVRPRHWKRIVLKELNVGFLNGIAIAVTASLCAGLWSGSLGLALVLALSMVIALVIAGLAGAAIPIVLSRLGQDPATASSIFLTTVTDIAGFFSFLGIATLLATML